MGLDVANLKVARGLLGRNRELTMAQLLQAVAAVGPSGAGIQPPLIWAHRGGNYQAPENSYAAWDISAAAGFALEGDWRLSSDNALVSMHDATVDRTTSSSGNVTAFTLAQFQAMDNGSKWSPAYAAQRVPDFESFIQRYPNAWLCPECSDQTTAALTKMCSLLTAYGADTRSIVQMFENAPYTKLAAAKAAFPNITFIALHLTGGPAPDLNKVAAAGVEWVGCDINSAWVNAAWVQSARDVGVKVCFYTIDDYASLTLALAYGFDALFTGRPFAMRRLGRAVPAPPSEQWTGQNRNMFGDDWQLTNMTQTNAAGCRPNNGYAGTDLLTLLGGVFLAGRPLPASGTYQIKGTLVSQLTNADTTRWAAVQIALQQDAAVFFFAPCNGSGYQCLIRYNGSMEIARCDNGVASTTLNTFAGTAPVIGTAIPFTIDVTPTQITFTRNDNGQSVTATDSTYRGGLLGLMWSNMAARFGPIHGA